ncbi:MAG: hypothetical protein AAFW73_10290 [Bacteroidota bacterium]
MARGKPQPQQEIEALRQQLLAAKEQLQQRRRRVLRALIGLLAAALLALALLPYAFPAPLDTEALFAQHFQVHPWPVTSHPASEELEARYRSGDFAGAEAAFAQYHRRHPQDTLSLLVAATVQLALARYEAASTQLRSLLPHTQASTLASIRWYLALAELARGEIAACRRQLLFLTAQPQANHHQAARALLRDLES